MEACERKKRKQVVLFLLEYPPRENLCEERGDMQKQALKLFIVACYIMYCLAAKKSLPVFLYIQVVSQTVKQMVWSEAENRVRWGETLKKCLLFLSL